MAKDEWVRAAMRDDQVVVDLLIRMKQAQASPSKPFAVIPLRWGLRLPRSKPPSASSDADNVPVVSRRKDSDSSTRCSPTTPLSWSGGGSASPSATADGFEETSRRSSPSLRSKVNAETTSATNTKRSRKRKAFAELRIEENLLLKENMHLKKEIAILNSTFSEQRSRNESLKRIKLDLNLQYAKESSIGLAETEEAFCGQPHQREPSSPNRIMSTLPKDANTLSSSCQTNDAISHNDKSFVLPDLNMMPTEEDSAAGPTEALPGTR